MIQPFEMKKTRPIKLHDGVTTTTDVWNMLTASRDGDLARVKELARHCPALLTCQYDYTAPLHLAVREGRLDLVRYLVEQGALDPGYKNHPFLEPLVTIAEDREYAEIVAFLKQSLDDPELIRAWGDTGGIDYSKDETQRRFQELVGKNQHPEVEAMLKERPELALDEDAFWGGGHSRDARQRWRSPDTGVAYALRRSCPRRVQVGRALLLQAYMRQPSS
jgi:uncharacterized protein